MASTQKQIPDYPHYTASNLGLILRIDTNQMMRGSITAKGYRRVCLSNAAGHRSFYVHQLIALAFLGQCPNGKQVNHVNGDKTDNGLENLEYVSPHENTIHAYSTGLVVRPQKNGNDSLQRFREANRKHYNKRRNAGICPRCQSDAQIGNRSMCADCKLKRKLKASG